MIITDIIGGNLLAGIWMILRIQFVQKHLGRATIVEKFLAQLIPQINAQVLGF